MSNTKQLVKRLAATPQAIVFLAYSELPKGTKYYLDESKPFEVKGQESFKVLPGERVSVLQNDLDEARQIDDFGF